MRTTRHSAHFTPCRQPGTCICLCSRVCACLRPPAVCLLSGPVVVRLAEIAEPLYANVNVNENEFRSAPRQMCFSNVLTTMSERTAAPAEAPCETPAETDEQETPLFMTRMPIKLNDALEAIAAIIDEEEVPTSSSVHSAPASSNTSRKRRSGLGAAQVALSLSCIAEAETLHLPAKRGRCIGREAHPLESGLLTGEGRVWV